VRKAVDLGMQLGRDRIHTEPLKRIHQSVSKAVKAVTMRHDAFPLHIIEYSAHLLGRKLVMIEEGNESRDGTLEVNIVFPERIIRVDQEGLRRQAYGSLTLTIG
jgi:hypothetical protein